MAIDPAAFERYRRSPNERTTLPRMAVGVLIVVACWFATTIAVVLADSYGWIPSGPDFDTFGDTFGTGEQFAGEQFLGTTAGLFATLASFSGIWLGVWIAMRLLHKERLSRLFGNSARISRHGFLNGFLAVTIVSLISELGYLAVMPGISRGPVGLGLWALLVVPVILLAFVQTSAEELLFRGYLQRGLASRFRSRVAWAVLPTIVFTALHWSPAASIGMNTGIVVSIAAFAALLALLVYVTGNLGAAMGAHLGNNLVGFALVSHDETLGGLALFQASALDGLAWTTAQTLMIAGISLVSVALTWLLLLHPRSPLRVQADLGRLPAE